MSVASGSASNSSGTRVPTDNGKEFAHHEAITHALSAGFYFAHLRASWARWLSENTNGLVRQYFPKARGFSTITDSDVRMVVDRLNKRSRKCLGMQTPNQVFFWIQPTPCTSESNPPANKNGLN